MAVYRSRGNFSSTSFASSWTLPAAPGVQNGDLLIMALASQEWIVGFSAPIVRPAGFTDLLADGYDPGSGCGLQYVLDPGAATPRLFVWVGYRVAASEPASYSISTIGTSGGLQGDVYAFALPGDILNTALDHEDASSGPAVASYAAPSVTLDTNHRELICLMFGGYLSTAVVDNGYVPPASMTLQARDATDGAPNDSWTLADETVAGSGGSSGTRTFTILSGAVTERAAISLSIGGTVGVSGGGLPLLGAG